MRRTRRKARPQARWNRPHHRTWGEGGRRNHLPNYWTCVMCVSNSRLGRGAACVVMPVTATGRGETTRQIGTTKKERSRAPLAGQVGQISASGSMNRGKGVWDSYRIRFQSIFFSFFLASWENRDKRDWRLKIGDARARGRSSRLDEARRRGADTTEVDARRHCVARQRATRTSATAWRSERRASETRALGNSKTTPRRDGA